MWLNELYRSISVSCFVGSRASGLAIRDGEVVEVADTPYALVARLRERSIDDASVIRAPAEDEPEMVAFG